ncbi:MAG: hypothetical protein AMK69_03230 [Nitrospira bacterium SG8_3]|nr:MAG: hypothetical protein AMK69_03230 [Nitrospira bacterium SG8_3]
MNKAKGKAEKGNGPAFKIAVSVIGWAVIIGLLLFRPKWVGIGFGIGFLGTILLALLVLYFRFVFLRAREAKREGGWLIAILTALGVMIFVALWLLLGFHLEKGHLPV